MIRCIAIDDEPLALDIIRNFSQEISYLSLEKTFTNPEEARKYLDKHSIDLIFCDIQMPEINGMHFCESLEKRPMIIFTTAFSEYAARGYEINAIDYLLKPFSFERFHAATHKAIDYYNYVLRHKEESREYLYVRSEYKLVKVRIQDIEYVEAMDDYIKIFCEGKRPILSKMTMRKIEEELPPNLFLRIHRSYIISIPLLKFIRNKRVQLPSVELPIGNKYEEEVEKRIS